MLIGTQLDICFPCIDSFGFGCLGLFLTNSIFLMKNLLLIFFLGFALFWMGCEKEEIVVLDKEQAQQIKTNPEASEQPVAFSERMPPPDLCCEITAPFTFSSYATNSTSSGYLTRIDWGGFTVPKDIAYPAIVTIYTNGNYYDDYQFTEPCQEINSAPPLFVDEMFFAECPREIKVVVSLTSASSSGDPISCGYEEFVYNAPFPNNTICSQRPRRSR